MPRFLSKLPASLVTSLVLCLLPSIALAQNSAAAKETTIHGGVLVIISYIALWVLIFGFVAFVLRKQASVIADLAEVEGRLDKYFDALPEKPE